MWPLHSACPYNAISDVLRPCIRVCPTKAISIDEKQKKAVIDEKKSVFDVVHVSIAVHLEQCKISQNCLK